MFFIEDKNFTKFGYYQIGNIKTLSKYEAWTFSKEDPAQIKFIFNDDVMDQQDWATEPVEDIYELYRQRAQQLRNDYDYLVLMYSGGIDSTTIFETFLNNGIKLDEVCSFSNADVDDKDNKFNQEIFNRAIPVINGIELGKSGTKFRYVEIGKLVVDQWADEFHYENFHHYSNGPQWWVTRSHKFKESIEDHMKLTEQGKKVCYIWGYDKPHLVIEDGKFGIKFIDAAVDIGARQFTNHSLLKEKFLNFYDEPFYISKDFPKISIKQGHMLIKLLATIPLTDSRIVSRDQLPATGPFVMVPNTDNKYLTKKTVDGCIYPRALLHLFGDDKVRGSIVFSAKDKWFTQSNHENRFLWDQKMREIVTKHRNYFTYFKSKEFGLVPRVQQAFRSKTHFIKSIDQ